MQNAGHVRQQADHQHAGEDRSPRSTRTTAHPAVTYENVVPQSWSVRFM